MPADSYDPAFYPHLFEVEDRHFWFRARNEVIATLARQLTAGLAPGYQVLEVGCGTGNTLRVLEAVCGRGMVVGMDLHHEGLRLARRRVACPLLQADVNRPPLQPGFALIGLFDVLEHIPDDGAVLRGLGALLAPGGRLLLTVPAHRALWSYFDEVGHHCRRYEPGELRARLLQAGYRVEFLSPFMTALFPLVWLGRRLGPLRAWLGGRKRSSAAELARGELRVVPGLNQALTWLLRREVPLLERRRRLTLGTSLLAIAGRDAPDEKSS